MSKCRVRTGLHADRSSPDIGVLVFDHEDARGTGDQLGGHLGSAQTVRSGAQVAQQRHSRTVASIKLATVCAVEVARKNESVAQHRREGQQRHQDVHVEPGGGDHRSGNEQQRIARQEREDHEPGLGENHQEQERVQPRAVLRRERGERLVEREQRVQQSRQHRGRDCRRVRSRPAAGDVQRSGRGP